VALAALNRPFGFPRRSYVVRMGVVVNIAAMPEWRQVLRDQYWSPDAWRTSAKGNSYVRIDRYCVTAFQRRDGWSWCIATDAKHAPLWSGQTYMDESDARVSAWEALCVLAKAFA
jgi:hypothetical protein